MKKAAIVIFLAFIAFSAFCMPLKITTENGTKTVQVEEKYIIEQRRYYLIQGSRNIETWLIIENAYYIDNKWSDWEKMQETPYNFFVTNRDLEDMISLLIEYAVELNNNGIDMVYVPSQNNQGQKYWWESRKYLNILRKLYIIKK